MSEPREKLTHFPLPAEHTVTLSANAVTDASAGKTSSGVTCVLLGLEGGQKGQEHVGEQASLVPLC